MRRCDLITSDENRVSTISRSVGIRPCLLSIVQGLIHPLPRDCIDSLTIVASASDLHSNISFSLSEFILYGSV